MLKFMQLQVHYFGTTNLCLYLTCGLASSHVCHRVVTHKAVPSYVADAALSASMSEGCQVGYHSSNTVDKVFTCCANEPA